MEEQKERVNEAPQEEKQQSFFKAKLIAGILLALVIFGFGFYLGTRYYSFVFKAARFFAWFIPILLILLVIAIVIFVIARKKFKK